MARGPEAGAKSCAASTLALGGDGDAGVVCAGWSGLGVVNLAYPGPRISCGLVNSLSASAFSACGST